MSVWIIRYHRADGQYFKLSEIQNRKYLFGE